MARAQLASIVIFLLTLVPVLDQIACVYCGPTPETSMRLEAVSHLEYECLLGDGFERNSGTAGDESIHIHYCLLHSTFSSLVEALLIEHTDPQEPVLAEHMAAKQPRPTSLFRPPRLI